MVIPVARAWRRWIAAPSLHGNVDVILELAPQRTEA